MRVSEGGGGREEEEAEEGVDTELKTKTPHVNVGKNHRKPDSFDGKTSNKHVQRS